MAINLRGNLGRPLTFSEVDENFTTLDDEKVSTTARS